MTKSFKSVLFIIMLVLSTDVFAQQIALQGILRDQTGRSVSDGNYALTFSLYTTASGGAAIWTETQPTVAVQRGIYSVYLGSVNSLASVNFDAQYYLGVSINGAAELTPRITLSTVPYARGVIGVQNKFPSSGDITIGGNASLTGNLTLGAGGKLTFNDGTELTSAAVSSVVATGEVTLRNSGNNAIAFRYGANLPGVLKQSFTLGGSHSYVPFYSEWTSAESADYFSHVMRRDGTTRWAWYLNDSEGQTSTYSLNAYDDNGGWLRNTLKFYRDGKIQANGTSAGDNTAFQVSTISSSGGEVNAALGVHVGDGTWLKFYKSSNYNNVAVIKNVRPDGGHISFATDAGRHVLIGTDLTISNSPLQIGASHFGTIGPVFPNNRYFDSSTEGIFRAGAEWQHGGISIHAVGRYIGEAFHAISDARIKNVIGISSSTADLNLLNKIEVVDYTYIDKIAKGNQVIKKVVAQDLEKIFPSAVSKSIDIIPNVYEVASTQTFDAALKTIAITTTKKHDFIVGDEVKLITDSKEMIKKVTEVIDEHSFKIESEEAIDRIFVYGKKVNDFRTVDYEAVAMLNVSATQELFKRIVALEKQVETLKGIEAKHASLSNEVDALKAMMQQFLSNQAATTTAQPSQN
jgi:hypothetical protein